MIPIPRECKICFNQLKQVTFQNVDKNYLLLICDNNKKHYHDSHYRFTVDRFANINEKLETSNKEFRLTITYLKNNTVIVYYVNNTTIDFINLDFNSTNINYEKQIKPYIDKFKRLTVMS